MNLTTIVTTSATCSYRGQGCVSNPDSYRIASLWLTARDTNTECEMIAYLEQDDIASDGRYHEDHIPHGAATYLVGYVDNTGPYPTKGVAYIDATSEHGAHNVVYGWDLDAPQTLPMRHEGESLPDLAVARKFYLGLL